MRQPRSMGQRASRPTSDEAVVTPIGDRDEEHEEVEPEMRVRAGQQAAQRVDLVAERVDLAQNAQPAAA